MTSAPAHGAFEQARAELETVGFALGSRPFPGSRPYAVIGGRSNARWWLVPLESRRLTASGLALFQPVIASARLLKAAALVATGVGLSRLWARRVLHVAGGAALSEVFRDDELRFSFFTGTDGPHRKLAVQVMGESGSIRGFAKVSCDAGVRPLLSHEASVLRRVGGLGLRSALVPAVLFSGRLGGAEVLVTDTRKTAACRTLTVPGPLQAAFLRELADRTARTDAPGWLGRTLLARLEALAPRLPEAWRRRLTAATEAVDARTRELSTRALSHGDFTASNTFLVDGALYVFDWEYATEDAAPAHDLIHFVLSAPAIRRLDATRALALAGEALRTLLPERAEDPFVLVLSYLAIHALHYAAREPADVLATWAGEADTARLLDAALEQEGLAAPAART